MYKTILWPTWYEFQISDVSENDAYRVPFKIAILVENMMLDHAIFGGACFWTNTYSNPETDICKWYPTLLKFLKR